MTSRRAFVGYCSHFPPREGLIVTLRCENLNRVGNPVRFPLYSWSRNRRPEMLRKGES